MGAIRDRPPPGGYNGPVLPTPVDDGSDEAFVRTRCYRDGKLDDEDFPLDMVSEHLDQEGTVVWVDLCGPSSDQLHALEAELGLHELAVEDALGRHQRPKLDHYDDHLFLTCHAVELDLDAETPLRKTECDTFINPRWLITVHHDRRFPIDEVVARWDRSAQLAQHGTSFLLYGLLDVVVDGYLDLVQGLDDYFDDVADAIFSERPIPPDRQRQWFRMRRELVHFHRLVGPTRETVSALMRREQGLIAEPLHPYYQDVYDHVLRANESTEALRDLVSSIVETNLSLRDYRQNQIMKKVTSWAAVVAVPTLITGYYGMNVPYPGYGDTWGVWASVALIAVCAGALWLLFRRKDWL